MTYEEKLFELRRLRRKTFREVSIIREQIEKAKGTEEKEKEKAQAK